MMFLSDQTIIIKCGSALLVDGNYALNRDWMYSLAQDIADLQKQGISCVLVSSGSVACGRNFLPDAHNTLTDKQALSAIGQIHLAHTWSDVFAQHGLTAAQILLTLSDIENRRRHLNARETLQKLLENNIVPVINENDTTATAELRYGDNDRLAATVGHMLGSDCVVLLSDVDGLYTDNPHQNPKAEHLPEIAEITEDVTDMASGVSSNVGSGGMNTKLLAADIAMKAGSDLIITDGRKLHPLCALQNGATHTLFKAEINPRSARKAWVSGIISRDGSITIDDGAIAAIQNGNSLLPIGIRSINDTFSRGDVIAVLDQNGNEVAHGLASLGSTDMSKVLGKHSREMEEILGYSGRDVAIHADDMVSG